MRPSALAALIIAAHKPAHPELPQLTYSRSKSKDQTPAVERARERYLKRYSRCGFTTVEVPT